MGQAPKPTVTRVRPDKETATKQKLAYFSGISGQTAGATGLSMNLVVVPPGGSAEPHYHKDFEAAIYLLEGRVETRYGEGLAESVITEKGDFLFIPAGMPHQPFNLSDHRRPQPPERTGKRGALPGEEGINPARNSSLSRGFLPQKPSPTETQA